MKHIVFKEGFSLPVFSPYPDYYIEFSAEEQKKGFLPNGVIAVASENNGWANARIANQKYHDLSNNEWNFIYNSSTPNVMTLRITRPDETYVDFPMQAYSGIGQYTTNYYYLYGEETTEGVKIYLYSRRPAMYNSTTSNQTFRDYVNGICSISSTEQYYFKEDKTEVDTDNIRLCDKSLSDTSLFYDVECFCYSEDMNRIFSEVDFYLGISSAGSGSANSFTYSYDQIALTDVEENPYIEAGIATEDMSNDGSFILTNDPISVPTLPTISAADTGMITLFNPSLSQLQSLSNYLWSNLFDIETVKKLFADPMDAILGLSIVPVNVPNGAAKTVMVSGVPTDVVMITAASQFVDLDCGGVEVNGFFGSYLDYAPFSKLSIYLPYIGVHPLNVDEFVDKVVMVRYRVDILTGACVAYISDGDGVRYSFAGSCSINVPITGNSWNATINAAINIASSIGTMVATGGATAPATVGTMAAAAVNSMKPEIERSGSLSGSAGFLNVQTPYLIIEIPNIAYPYNLPFYEGLPSYITKSLGSITGYTEVEKVHLENIVATSEEIAEIESLLKSGVIF